MSISVPSLFFYIENYSVIPPGLSQLLNKIKHPVD